MKKIYMTLLLLMIAIVSFAEDEVLRTVSGTLFWARKLVPPLLIRNLRILW